MNTPDPRLSPWWANHPLCHTISGLHVTSLSPNSCCSLTSYAAGFHQFGGPLSLHSSPGTAWTRFPQVLPSTAPSRESYMAYGGPASITRTLRRDSKNTSVPCIFRTYSEGLRNTQVADGLRRATLAIVPSKATEQQQRDMRPSSREASTQTSSCLLARHLRPPSQVTKSVKSS